MQKEILMLLTHTCPNCGDEHEMECTPEPSQLCPDCKEDVKIDAEGMGSKEYPHITSRIEIDVDCVNTTINGNEEMFLQQEITKIIEARGMKVLRYLTL
jgi:hypothetical protein